MTVLKNQIDPVKGARHRRIAVPLLTAADPPSSTGRACICRYPYRVAKVSLLAIAIDQTHGDLR